MTEMASQISGKWLDYLIDNAGKLTHFMEKSKNLTQTHPAYETKLQMDCGLKK